MVLSMSDGIRLWPRKIELLRAENQELETLTQASALDVGGILQNVGAIEGANDRTHLGVARYVCEQVDLSSKSTVA